MKLLKNGENKEDERWKEKREVNTSFELKSINDIYLNDFYYLV